MVAELLSRPWILILAALSVYSLVFSTSPLSLYVALRLTD